MAHFLHQLWDKRIDIAASVLGNVLTIALGLGIVGLVLGVDWLRLWLDMRKAHYFRSVAPSILPAEEVVCSPAPRMADGDKPA